MTNHTTGSHDELKLVITRVFDAPREIVWQAWTDMERFKQWFKSNDSPKVLSTRARSRRSSVRGRPQYIRPKCKAEASEVGCRLPGRKPAPIWGFIE